MDPGMPQPNIFLPPTSRHSCYCSSPSLTMLLLPYAHLRPGALSPASPSRPGRSRLQRRRRGLGELTAWLLLGLQAARSLDTALQKPARDAAGLAQLSAKKQVKPKSPCSEHGSSFFRVRERESHWMMRCQFCAPRTPLVWVACQEGHHETLPIYFAISQPDFSGQYAARHARHGKNRWHGRKRVVLVALALGTTWRSCAAPLAAGTGGCCANQAFQPFSRLRFSRPGCKIRQPMRPRLKI